MRVRCWQKCIIVALLVPCLLVARPSHAFGPTLFALNPATLGVMVAAGGVLAAGAALYAPAVHDAADLVVSQSGSIARKLWAVNTMIDFVETATGQYLYGKAVTAWARVQDMIDYVRSLPDQFPIFNSAIDAASQPQGSSVVQTGAVVYVPDVGWRVLGDHKSGVDRYCVSATSLPGWNGYVVGGPWDYIAYFSGTGAVGFMALVGDPGTSGCFAGDVPVDVDVWYSSATSPPVGGEFDPAAFADNLDTADPAVAAEIDALIQQRPDFWVVSDGDVLTISQSNDPPVAWTGYDPADISVLEYVNADLAAQLADDIQAMADANPDDVSLQVEALRAQIEAQQAQIEALEAEQQQLDIPYTPAPLAQPYTLPAVDFGARLEQFFADIQATPLFSLPTTILGGGFPEAGTSVITFDGGVYGQHTFDFADYANVLLTLRAILFTVFAYLAVRVVVLKR